MRLSAVAGFVLVSGILTYLSDGTRTLPVRRATWVLDTLWNQSVPPPPPNAADLPPLKDRKQRSVRERLDEHRQSENCASCHTRVDPFGMALENYDATGMWRDRQNGEGMRGDANSPMLDVSGKLPDGTEFKTLQEFKASLLARRESFVKGFTEKLLCYALGRPIGYSEYTRRMFDMIALAFQTDSTRVVSHIPRTEGDEGKCYGYLTKSAWDLHTITGRLSGRLGHWHRQRARMTLPRMVVAGYSPNLDSL